VSQYCRLLVLPLLALALTSSAEAGNTKTYTDPAGDVTVVPDIVSITATSTDPSTVTFRTEFAGSAQFGGGVGFSLLLDADDSRATGHSDGVDYTFDLARSDGSFQAARWDGATFSPYDSRAKATVGANAVTIRFNVKELSPVGPAFRFSAWTYDDTHLDQAPPPFDYFRFETKLRPAVRFTPTRPAAGKRFRVVKPGSATCRARIAGKTLRPLGRCLWLIPKRTAGRRLTVVVRSKKYVFVVRRT
jgi:hypothetical protein